MKKVMIGILILIPIIILLIVAIVANLVATVAWVAVEDITLYAKGTERPISHLELPFEEVAGKTFKLEDYISVKVSPERANRYTVSWSIDGKIVYDDEAYEQSYKNYVDKKDEDENLEEVLPAVMFVNDQNVETSSNSTSACVVSSYCSFYVKVQAEQKSAVIPIRVVGFAVERVDLKNKDGESSTSLRVGQSERVYANYSPLDSIVEDVKWSSSDSDVVSVDGNGVITARSTGTAQIYAEAAVYRSEDGKYVKNVVPFNVTVTEGTSSVWGDVLYTTKTNLSLEELGLPNDATPKGDGCIVAGGIVNVRHSGAVLTSQKGDFTIFLCDEDDIAIQHSELFNYAKDDDFVLAVGENPLRLTAVFRDSAKAKEGAPEGVTWDSSNKAVATIGADGVVRALSSGTTTISAERNGKRAEFTLNVQNKVSTLRLKTSDSSFKKGLAQETVFASEKFVQPDLDNTVTANSTLIQIVGEPGADEAGNLPSEEELRQFYNAYWFEVVSGAEFASFSGRTPNELVFDSQALEGKGKQIVKVRVRAKYPKYEAVSKFTTEEVDVKVIYGVEVSTGEALSRACDMQEAYAKAADNVMPVEKVFTTTTAEGVTYEVQNSEYSKKTYAIVLANDIEFPKNYANVDLDTCFVLNGDLYGNDHKISATKQQNSKSSNWKNCLVFVQRSNVTVSNVTIRANELDEGEQLSASNKLKGYPLRIGCMGGVKARILNVLVEYTVLENGNNGIRPDDSDFTLDGVVMRNISNVGIYSYARIEDGPKDDIFELSYVRITANNCAFANVLGPTVSLAYERYTITDDKECRFVKGDPEANARFFLENIASKGHNLTFKQTGFLDIYNWKNVNENIDFIDTGSDTYNQIISVFAGAMCRENPAFKQGLYDYGGEKWFNLGFSVFGVSVSQGILDEPTYTDLSLEDDRIFSIYSKDLKSVGNAESDIAVEILKTMEIKLYAYKNTSDLTPATALVINDAFIKRLHS